VFASRVASSQLAALGVVGSAAVVPGEARLFRGASDARLYGGNRAFVFKFAASATFGDALSRMWWDRGSAEFARFCV
jgi:hypothetical protein